MFWPAVVSAAARGRTGPARADGLATARSPRSAAQLRREDRDNCMWRRASFLLPSCFHHPGTLNFDGCAPSACFGALGVGLGEVCAVASNGVRGEQEHGCVGQCGGGGGWSVAGLAAALSVIVHSVYVFRRSGAYRDSTAQGGQGALPSARPSSILENPSGGLQPSAGRPLQAAMGHGFHATWCQ
jgi:hypothetical protein